MLFCFDRGCTLPRGASEILAQAPRWPVSARGRARLSQVTGPSSCHVPWSATPPSAPPSCLLSTTSLLPSGLPIPWALGNPQFRGCTHTARVFACLRIAREHHCPLAQGSLPACRARLWPGGFRTRWTTSRNFMIYRMSSFLSDQHFLVAPVACSWAGRGRRKAWALRGALRKSRAAHAHGSRAREPRHTGRSRYRDRSRWPVWAEPEGRSPMWASLEPQRGALLTVRRAPVLRP